MSTSAGLIFDYVAPSPLDKQSASYKLTHDWLVRLDMDVAVLCIMWS